MMRFITSSDFYAEIILGLVMLIPVGFGYVSAVLRRLAREQDARARDNEVRDVQRGEILENVRRIANGKAVVHPTARLTSGARRANKGRRRGARRAAEIQHRSDEVWMERKGLGSESKDDQAGDDQS
jgi:hypothetical protein